MFEAHAITGPDERFCSLAGFPLAPEMMTRQVPDSSWVLSDADGRPVGRCSLWWKATPSLEGRRVGYVGHFAVTEDAAAVPLLQLGCEQLREQGCEVAVGPVDGNTWQRYRLLTERGSEPPYFLEPDNPDDWPGHFLAAGFSPLAGYCSALNTDLDVGDPRLPGIAQTLADAGIRIRPLDSSHFEEEMRRVHALSLVSFRNNFLYTPIAEAEFMSQYTALRPHVRDELVLLAEQGNELVGFLFAFPDYLRARRGEVMDTVILKTLAVHPDRSGLGLGTMLMARGHEVGRKLGFRRAIHALFHESNRSGRISGHTARVFRRYTLYEHPLR
jgi:GNAT superfamily N-acetyltransferase